MKSPNNLEALKDISPSQEVATVPALLQNVSANRVVIPKTMF